MSRSKVRILALGLLAAGAVAAGLFVSAGQDLRSGLRAVAAEPAAPAPTPANQNASGVRVDAPGTQVDVDKERGKVSVTAPHTDVKVDPDAGRVQVRAPYVNLDVRW
jgi:hypothetical protein